MTTAHFFEKNVPGRGDGYFQFDQFKKVMEELLKEQEASEAAYYLIRNCNGTIVGRINLTEMDKSAGTASLGYRVGEKFIGKGVANRALTLLLESLASSEINEVSAKTTMSNTSSQRVLENNNFLPVIKKEEWAEWNGKREKFVHYIWKNSNSFKVFKVPNVYKKCV
ncbi:MAG: GNAT family N-acetyltransferase [Bacillus sp. (in: Bacteria)]|nr:GNAT family N-acetyltransferase [Bacillus sp. (in: firmicutes)]